MFSSFSLHPFQRRPHNLHESRQLILQCLYIWGFVPAGLLPNRISHICNPVTLLCVCPTHLTWICKRRGCLSNNTLANDVFRWSQIDLFDIYTPLCNLINVWEFIFFMKLDLKGQYYLMWNTVYCNILVLLLRQWVHVTSHNFLTRKTEVHSCSFKALSCFFCNTLRCC